jgi:hypothetical protein
MIVLATFDGVLKGVTRSWRKGEEIGKATFEFDPDLLTDEDIRRFSLEAMQDGPVGGSAPIRSRW